MKRFGLFVALVLVASGYANATNVTYPGKVLEVRRESNSITCTWSDMFLLVRVGTASSSIWLRLSASAAAFKDIESLTLAALAAKMNVTVVHDGDPSCITSGNMMSISLVP